MTRILRFSLFGICMVTALLTLHAYDFSGHRSLQGSASFVSDGASAQASEQYLNRLEEGHDSESESSFPGQGF